MVSVTYMMTDLSVKKINTARNDGCDFGDNFIYYILSGTSMPNRAKPVFITFPTF